MDKKSISIDQEKKLAKLFDGRRQPSSGAFPGLKGDVKADNLLIEAKYTERKSFTITQDILIKITKQALAYNKIPVVAIEFATMPLGTSKDWILVEVDTFKELLDVYKQFKEGKPTSKRIFGEQK